MFGKSDQTRINDTLNVIANAPYLQQVIRGQIVTFVNNQFQRQTQQQRQAYRALSDGMSVKGHMAPGVASGNAAEREKRRAIYLLWAAIAEQQQGQLGAWAQARKASAMSLPAGAPLDAALEEAMYKAAVVSSVAGAQHVFDELYAHPVRFLGRHKVFVRGSTVGQAKFAANPPAGAGFQNVLNFEFQYDGSSDRFVLRADHWAAWGCSYRVPSISVVAVHWTQVPGLGAAAPYNFTGIAGVELTGANFMLTTQFTGCTFNWTNHGGVIRASHISPSGGAPAGTNANMVTYPGGGIALAQRVMANGQMANAANTACTVFGGGAGNAPVTDGGPPHYPNSQMVQFQWSTIIGVIKNGNWRMYNQVVDNQGAITAHRRIY